MPPFLTENAVPGVGPATLLMMAGPPGPSGLPAPRHVAMESSNVVALVTASTTDVRARQYRQGPATSRSVTRDLNRMVAGVTGPHGRLVP